MATEPKKHEEEYRGYRLTLWRGRAQGGWATWDYTAVRLSDGYTLIDGAEEFKGSAAGRMAYLRKRVDQLLEKEEHQEPDPTEPNQGEKPAVEPTPDQIDWRQVALGLLDCFSESEGTVFSRSWPDYGIPEPWHEAIYQAWSEHHQTKTQADAGTLQVEAPEAPTRIKVTVLRECRNGHQMEHASNIGDDVAVAMLVRHSNKPLPLYCDFCRAHYPSFDWRYHMIPVR